MFIRAVLILYLFMSKAFASTKTLKVAAYELDPYITESGEEHGYLFDIVKESFHKAGYNLDIQFYPRLRARLLVEAGERDVLIPTYSSSKSNGLVFSQPLHGSPIVYIKLKDVKPSATPVMASALDDSALDLNALKEINRDAITSFPVEKTAQLIDMLNQKRLDVAIADKYVAAQAIVSHRPHLLGKIHFMDPPIVQKEFHVAFSQKNPESQKLLMAFNNALFELQKSGRYQAILKRYGYSIPNETPNSLTIVTVDNEDMKVMESLSQHFTKSRPGVRLNWITLEENLLRRRIQSSIALNDGAFDIFTIGAWDTSVYAENGWVEPFESLPESYHEADILPMPRKTLSRNGKYYALPFYAETTMTYYRRDLFEKAGLAMPNDPTYTDIESLAAKLHNPEQGVNGICLRGKAGWGENGSLISILVHSFGGLWFNKNWQPQMDSQPWLDAIGFYASLLKRYGPKDVYRNGYSENLELFANGHCAIWIDATVAASYLSDSQKSRVAGRVGYAFAPKMKTDAARQWNWTWALAIPQSSKLKPLAKEFIRWATSKEYIALVAKEKGPSYVPPATRRSTYNDAYLKAAPFASFTLKAFDSYKPLQEYRKDAPYRGEIFVEIPEFPAIGVAVGNRVAAILKGKEELKEALQNAQRDVRSIMYQSGYYRNGNGTEKKK